MQLAVAHAIIPELHSKACDYLYKFHQNPPQGNFFTARNILLFWGGGIKCAKILIFALHRKHTEKILDAKFTIEYRFRDIFFLGWENFEGKGEVQNRQITQFVFSSLTNLLDRALGKKITRAISPLYQSLTSNFFILAIVNPQAVRMLLIFIGRSF